MRCLRCVPTVRSRLFPSLTRRPKLRRTKPRVPNAATPSGCSPEARTRPPRTCASSAPTSTSSCSAPIPAGRWTRGRSALDGRMPTTGAWCQTVRGLSCMPPASAGRRIACTCSASPPLAAPSGTRMGTSCGSPPGGSGPWCRQMRSPTPSTHRDACRRSRHGTGRAWKSPATRKDE